MKRLFTFGCSFTRYHWPTWADIIAKDFDYYENWGMSGGGNHYIFNSLVECNHRHKFSKNDTVIIMWTNIARDDRYIQDRWVCPGNIFHPNKNNKDILKSKIVCTRGFLIRDLAYISAAISLLENQNVKFEMHSMMPLVVIDQYEKVMIEDTNIDDVLSLYNNTLQMIKSNVYEKIFNSNWSSKTTEFLSEANITKAYSTNKDNIFLEWLF